MSLESSVSFWDALSFWLITLGVILTFCGAGASIMFRRYNHRLVVLTDGRNRQEKAVNERAIADATARAAGSDERAAKAEQASAEANLALARFKAPRQLTPEQSKNVADAVRRFAGVNFTISVFNDPESINLLTQIDDALVGAGWIETDWKGGGDISFSRSGHPNAGFNFLQGLYVQAEATRMNEFGPAVALLVTALNNAGLEAKGELGNMPPNAKGVIQIQVGKK
jgi:hypothetical protein